MQTFFKSQTFAGQYIHETGKGKEEVHSRTIDV